MAVKYKVVSKRPGGFAGENAPRYYPIVTDREIMDLNQVCDFISENLQMHSAHVKGVLETFTRVVPTLLKNGHNVRLDGFGTFSLHVSSKGQDSLEKVTSRDITGIKMAFLPDKRIKRALRTTHFEKSKKV